jgi:hypothetical protein
MARRGQDGSDKLHNRRKEALKAKDFKSKDKTKSKVPDIIISCEDSISSPAYFKEIIDNLIINKQITQDSFVLVPHDGGTQPSKVLERLKNYSDKNGKTFKDFHYKWIVIDRDVERTNGGGHTSEDFNLAINSAKSKKQKLNIEVAYSNDSFELWYLLHFDYLDTSFLRDEINVRLIKKLKEKNPHKFALLNNVNIKQANYTKHIYDELLTLQPTAIKNAIKLLESYGTVHNPECDISTTVYKLIVVLNDLNKIS